FVTATDNIATEQGTSAGSLTFTRVGSLAADLVVNYALGGTASNGVDYVALPTAVTIPAGKSSATVLVTPIDDALIEGSEIVVATITSSPGYNAGNPGSATVTIQDNEVPT